MPTYRGLGVNFGISSSLAAVTGKMQTRDHAYKSESELIKDGYGASVTKIYYDLSEEATFTYVASGASGGEVAVTVPTIGALMTVTDTGYGAVSGSTWLVDDVSTAGSNTGAVRATVKLSRYGAITS